MSKRIQFQRSLNVLRLRDVMTRSGLSRSQIYALVTRNLFPAPIKLGGTRASGWVEQELDAWISERILQRDRSA